MPSYHGIFFDLDHTLWDFETNSGEALRELYSKYELSDRTKFNADEFCETFSKVNTALWDQYDRGEIHRDILRTQRFHRVLTAAGIDDYEMSVNFSADYLRDSPRKGGLMPGTLEILEYLSPKYPLYIITNGFDEVQEIKMRSAGIHGYFKKIFSSERVGHKKPSREIFEHALSEIGSTAKQTVMIGDNLTTDIGGARNAGIDHIFYNPHKVVHQETVTWEIHHLSEIQNIL